MNKQSFITILLTVLMSMIGPKAFAHDIEVVNSDGVTIYYRWANDAKDELQVSFRGSDYYSYNEYSGDVVIPESVVYEGKVLSVTSIGYDTFRECVNLTSVTIPTSVSRIYEYAFAECSGLTCLVVNSDLVYVGYGVFFRSFNLKKVTFNCEKINLIINGIQSVSEVSMTDKVTSICDNAFKNCSSLTTVNIPNSVTSIGNNAFENCSSLSSLIIPQNVTNVGHYAFRGCSNLISVTALCNPSSIGLGVFDGCSNFKEATFDCEVVTTLFCSIPSIKKIIISENAKRIDQNAFNFCSGLMSIVIPNSVASIGDCVFLGCSSLTSVTIPINVTSIGKFTFAWCNNLSSVSIPNNVTSIADYAFELCINLQKVIIGDGVTKIGNRAFSGCSSLKYLAFGSQVKNIGQEAFSDCTAVSEIVSKALIAPVCGVQALDDINKWECHLFVPKGSMAEYESADQWKDFFFKEEGSGTIWQDDSQNIIGDINSDGTVNDADINEIVNYILGYPSEKFKIEAADVNHDDKVNVADIVKIANSFK